MGRALPQAGVEVLIATTDADGPHGRLPISTGTELTWQGVPTIFFHRQWSEGFKYSKPLAKWLYEHVVDFDVVHVHAVFSHACLAAASACSRRRVPYIVRPLGTLDPWSLQQKPIRKRVLWHIGGQRMLARAAAVHYTTISEQRLAERPLGLRRGVVIPLGVDHELFTDAASDDGSGLCGGHPYVLVLGRLHPKKGLEPFIEIFLHVTNSADLTGWRLAIAGDGDPTYVAALKRLVRQRGGDERIRFVGWLAGARKAVALREAALLALPSRQENFGVVVAEALACGTPVLVSNHVNLAEDIAAAGAGWVVPLERAAMLSSLTQALKDEDERRSRGIAGRELARAHFTWPAVANRLAGLYAEVARVA
jgi:glycosyltransferase involved in cell wall biosynthesis